MVKIKTLGKNLTEKDVDEDIKLIDFAYSLHTANKRFIKRWIRQHQIHRFEEEEIIYVHRYPKDKQTFIGIMRLKELDYFT